MYFLFWYYKVNLSNTFYKISNFWNDILKRTLLLDMITHIFTPMYQDTSKIGWIVSFVIRLMWIVTGSFAMFLTTFIVFSFLLFYLIAPIFCVFKIYQSLF